MEGENKIEIDMNLIQAKIYHMVATWHNLDVELNKKQELLGELSYKIAEVVLDEATKEISKSRQVIREKTNISQSNIDSKITITDNVWKSLKL